MSLNANCQVKRSSIDKITDKSIQHIQTPQDDHWVFNELSQPPGQASRQAIAPLKVNTKKSSSL